VDAAVAAVETATTAANQVISPATATSPEVEAVVVTPSSATNAKGLVTSLAIAELEPSPTSLPRTHGFEQRPSVDLKFKRFLVLTSVDLR